MLLATIAARFQEGLCVRIVANHIEGVDVCFKESKRCQCLLSREYI